mmetsp:Transcript_36545/g.65802  ORF Transcript_36545/g.65802 Transcript_36545/m.65802 type:complete len:225 (+) Transcript_36545:1135-1809(+)
MHQAIPMLPAIDVECVAIAILARNATDITVIVGRSITWSLIAPNSLLLKQFPHYLWLLLLVFLYKNYDRFFLAAGYFLLLNNAHALSGLLGSSPLLLADVHRSSLLSFCSLALLLRSEHNGPSISIEKHSTISNPSVGIGQAVKKRMESAIAIIISGANKLLTGQKRAKVILAPHGQDTVEILSYKLFTEVYQRSTVQSVCDEGYGDDIEQVDISGYLNGSGIL